MLKKFISSCVEVKHLLTRQLYLRVVNTGHVNPEEGIRKPWIRQFGGIGKIQIDDQNSEHWKKDVEPQFSKSDVCVVGRNESIPISIPEENMLLEDRLRVAAIDGT